MAVRRKLKSAKGEYDSDFFTVVCWRGLADIVAKYLAKGASCAVVGSIMTRDYTAKDGSKRYVTEIVADEVELTGGKREKAGENVRDDGHINQQGPAYEPGFTQVEDDELPF